MKLNPSKCAFGVNAGKFLGLMVTQRGIEVNPNEIKAVMETSALSSKKKLQRLTKCAFFLVLKSQRDKVDGRLSVCI